MRRQLVDHEPAGWEGTGGLRGRRAGILLVWRSDPGAPALAYQSTGCPASPRQRSALQGTHSSEPSNSATRETMWSRGGAAVCQVTGAVTSSRRADFLKLAQQSGLARPAGGLAPARGSDLPAASSPGGGAFFRPAGPAPKRRYLDTPLKPSLASDWSSRAPPLCG